MSISQDQISSEAGQTTPLLVAEIGTTVEASRPGLKTREKSARWIPFEPAKMQFSPAESLAWVLAVLGAAACGAPWIARGWFLLALAGAAVALIAIYDAIALWHSRSDFVPVLLPPEKGLRGREGQTIQLPLALAGSARRNRHMEIRVALMPATRDSETAMRANHAPQLLKLDRPATDGGSSNEQASAVLLWPWTPELQLLQRGLWPAPRFGTERRSRFALWQLRQWFDLTEPLRIDADLRPGRQEILRSPIYRAVVASRQTPWTGHGREFERLREYQPGDNYSEIAWKTTARRGAPVTRLFQAEQKQEVYFVVDQSRASAAALDSAAALNRNANETRAPRRLLDLAVETALVGATVALELGDEFGLVTFADEPKSWLREGGGQAQFHRFRDRLLSLEPLPTTADYEALFGEIRLRLRRRAYLIVLTDLAERSVSDSLCRGISLVRSTHAVLMTSILPAHARPAFSAAEEPQTDRDVYAALAGEKENQRLGALARQLRQLDVQLQFVPPESFLRASVEGYLQSKREQRL
jgi:uncharacterized protein (DUF58 family)